MRIRIIFLVSLVFLMSCTKNRNYERTDLASLLRVSTGKVVVVKEGTYVDFNNYSHKLFLLRDSNNCYFEYLGTSYALKVGDTLVSGQ